MRPYTATFTAVQCVCIGVPERAGPVMNCERVSKPARPSSLSKGTLHTHPKIKWIEPEGGVGEVSAGRAFWVRLRIDAGPRRSPSACAEVTEKKKEGTL